MDDLVKSISTIKNFMGNAGRNTCNDYLYEALKDAIECMEFRVPENSNIRIAEENTWVGRVVFHKGHSIGVLSLLRCGCNRIPKFL